MAKKITRDRTVDKGIFDEFIAGANLADESLNKLIDTQKELFKVSRKTVESLDLDKDVVTSIQTLEKEQQKLVKNAKQLNMLNEASAKIRKDRQKAIETEARLTAKLTSLKSGQLDETVKLRVQIQQENKEAKERAKVSLGLVDAYGAESKRLNNLRREYKNLVIQEKGATKEAEDLRKEIVKLDRALIDVDAATGEFGREVGNYPRTFNDATAAIVALTAGTLSFDNAIQGASNSIKAAEERSEGGKEEQAALWGGFDVLKNTLSGCAL